VAQDDAVDEPKLAADAGLWLALVGAIAFSACNPSQFVRSDADISRIVFSTLSDPKTFNPVLNDEHPNVFLYTTEGLTTQHGLTGEIVPATAEALGVF
jgi:peptide/nickel transport system substrate-binding protein